MGQSFAVAEPDTRTGGPRRPGRAAILDRAADRFAEAGLDQVVGAIAGVRDVAAAAGAAPATINHHFPPGGDRRNTRLATAALTHALLGHIGHNNEHYGNLVTYFRIKGLVPPSSRTR